MEQEERQKEQAWLAAFEALAKRAAEEPLDIGEEDCRDSIIENLCDLAEAADASPPLAPQQRDREDLEKFRALATEARRSLADVRSGDDHWGACLGMDEGDCHPFSFARDLAALAPPKGAQP